MWWIFYVHFTTGTSIIYPYRQRTKTETSSHLKIWYNQKLNLTQLNFIPKNAKRHSSKRTRIDSQISIYGCLLAPTSFISHSTSFLHVINNIIRFIIRTHSLTQKNSMSRRAFTSKNHVKSWELLIVPKREILNSYNQNQTKPNRTEPTRMMLLFVKPFHKNFMVAKILYTGEEERWANKNDATTNLPFSWTPHPISLSLCLNACSKWEKNTHRLNK